jgi:hypothetical protein
MSTTDILLISFYSFIAIAYSFIAIAAIQSSFQERPSGVAFSWLTRFNELSVPNL